MADTKRFRLLLAFATVYLVWGSTYLGIRYAIETIPPLLMAGTRFVLAGSVLTAIAFARGARRPEPRHWRTALFMGAMLLLGGNGLVTLAEQRINSGLAALLIASEPLWLVLIAWSAGKAARPGLREFAGIGLGFLGVALLLWPADLHSSSVDMLGSALVIISAVSWAAGSIYGMDAPASESPVLANGMTMLCGGTLQLITGFARGEAAQLNLAATSLTSILAMLYLVVFGSLLAFTAYTYLLTATTPAKASTYAFVNPVVAVLLGWAVANEQLNGRMVIAMVVIVGAVVLLTLRTASQAPTPESLPSECAGD